MNGVSFFIAEGLFFLGMSLGILGASDSERARQGAWILLTIGGLSLLAGFIAFAYQNRRRPKDPRSGAGLLKPISISAAFDSLLHSTRSLPLLKGHNFSSEIRSILNPIKVEVPANHTVVIQHFGGRSVAVTTADGDEAELRPGDVIRVTETASTTQLSVEAVDESDSERAPQILLHFINEQ